MRIGTGVFCVSGSHTSMAVSSRALLSRETASAVQLCDVPNSLECSFAAPFVGWPGGGGGGGAGFRVQCSRDAGTVAFPHPTLPCKSFPA